MSQISMTAPKATINVSPLKRAGSEQLQPIRTLRESQWQPASTVGDYAYPISDKMALFNETVKSTMNSLGANNTKKSACKVCEELKSLRDSVAKWTFSARVSAYLSYHGMIMNPACMAASFIGNKVIAVGGDTIQSTVLPVLEGAHRMISHSC
ncbi:MAG: hypothetical protein HQK54_18685 [Oligoflexales bacterium]|nr:hypothetical protein [Oligoflexales bacterium]